MLITFHLKDPHILKIKSGWLKILQSTDISVIIAISVVSCSKKKKKTQQYPQILWNVNINKWEKTIAN